MTRPRSTAEAAPLEVLLAEVQALPVSEAARQAFMQALRRMAGQRVFFARKLLVKPQRVRLARVLLDQGMTVADVRATLAERQGLTRSAAYRLITLALAQRFEERQMPLFGDAEQGAGGGGHG